MNEREFRVLVKHCFFIGKNTGQAQEWLEKCYTTIENASIPEKTTICRWYKEFADANNAESTNTAENAKSSGSNVANEARRKRATKSPTSESCLCDICGKVFSRTDALKNHRLIHSNNAPHQCQSCGKQFRDRKNLQVCDHVCIIPSVSSAK